MLFELLILLPAELLHRYLYPDEYKPPPEPTPEEPQDVVLSREFGGRRGKAFAMLRPVGTVIIDGVRHTARSQGEFISEGREVTVLRVESGELIVEATNDADSL